MATVCEKCRDFETTKKFKLCSSCKISYYCSIECQRKDWKIHKGCCNNLKKVWKRLDDLKWKEDCICESSEFSAEAFLSIYRRVHGKFGDEFSQKPVRSCPEGRLAEALFDFCYILDEFKLTGIWNAKSVEYDLKFRKFLLVGRLNKFLSPEECFRVSLKMSIYLLALGRFEEAFALCKGRLIAMEERLGDLEITLVLYSFSFFEFCDLCSF